MKLKEYIEGLNKFAQENPETLSMDVITSADDEGNGFNIVHYNPSKGVFEDSEFTDSEQFEESGIEDSETNAVCVN